MDVSEALSRKITGKVLEISGILQIDKVHSENCYLFSPLQPTARMRLAYQSRELIRLAPRYHVQWTPVYQQEATITADIDMVDGAQILTHISRLRSTVENSELQQIATDRNLHDYEAEVEYGEFDLTYWIAKAKVTQRWSIPLGSESSQLEANLSVQEVLHQFNRWNDRIICVSGYIDVFAPPLSELPENASQNEHIPRMLEIRNEAQLCLSSSQPTSGQYASIHNVQAVAVTGTGSLAVRVFVSERDGILYGQFARITGRLGSSQKPWIRAALSDIVNFYYEDTGYF